MRRVRSRPDYEKMELILIDDDSPSGTAPLLPLAHAIRAFILQSEIRRNLRRLKSLLLAKRLGRFHHDDLLEGRTFSKREMAQNIPTDLIIPRRQLTKKVRLAIFKPDWSRIISSCNYLCHSPLFGATGKGRGFLAI